MYLSKFLHKESNSNYNSRLSKVEDIKSLAEYIIAQSYGYNDLTKLMNDLNLLKNDIENEIQYYKFLSRKFKNDYSKSLPCSYNKLMYKDYKQFCKNIKLIQNSESKLNKVISNNQILNMIKNEFDLGLFKYNIYTYLNKLSESTTLKEVLFRLDTYNEELSKLEELVKCINYQVSECIKILNEEEDKLYE